MRETTIEKRLIDAVQRLGGHCIKVGKDGWPDRICVLPGGITFWVETKSKRGITKELQKLRHAQLKKIGHAVFVPKTSDGAKLITEHYIRLIAEQLDEERSNTKK